MQTANEVVSKTISNNRKIRELEKEKKRKVGEIKALQTENEEIMDKYEEDINAK